MNPKQFLQIGGAVLLLLGIAGLVGIFNKQSTPWFWLDNGENTAHVVLGVVALAAAYFLKDPNLQKWLVVVVGVFGLFAGSILGALISWLAGAVSGARGAA